MARTVRNQKIDTRSARSRLTQRREPDWTVISSGCAGGYRRGSTGGTWVARYRGTDGHRHSEALGAADDAMEPDGRGVLSFGQAQEKARQWFAEQSRGSLPQPSAPYTVNEALDDYFASRLARGSKGVQSDRSFARTRIKPELGPLELRELSTKKLRDWHTSLATAPKFVRRKAGAEGAATRGFDAADPEAVRARRATANRVLTVLKGALNHAFREGYAAGDEAWRKVKPFREVDAPVVRFLSAAECLRLVTACDGGFRNLVRGALLTGCRYGELARLQAGDFNAAAGTITVRISKAGKARHVALTEEGAALFAGLTAGRENRELIFKRADGEAWAPSHQVRPIAEASARAKITPAATFHILRHTYASTLAMRGVPMGVIAAQLGHADTRMTEKHYAHLAPNYVAETVRAALPDFGLIADGEKFVTSLDAVRGRL